MSHPVVPDMTSLAYRIPEGGRIRMGAKGGPGGMKTLDQWRITSQNRVALETLADKYGGEVRPWRDPSANPPDQFELYTHTSTLLVYLIPGSLSQTLEKWGNGYRQRTCLGNESAEACEVLGEGQDGESQLVPCICLRKGVRECSPTSRLSVLFPELPPLAWRLDTKSWNALVELPGMVQVIEMLSSQKVTLATLDIENRQSKTFDRKGKPVTRKFKMPVLAPADSSSAILQLGTGPMTDVPALERAAVNPYGELGAGPVDDVPVGVTLRPAPSAALLDDDVVDAEIVDDDAGSDTSLDDALNRLFEALIAWDDSLDTGEFTRLLLEQTSESADKILACAVDIEAGQIVPKIVNGKAVRGRP